MTANTSAASPSLLVVMLHWLGGSAGSWSEVNSGLSKLGMCCEALDLPGFGAEAEATDFRIEAMTEQVIARVGALRRNDADTPWILAGHSMGGKVAMIVARAASAGREELSNLAALVLISPSPPTPEPMKESKRDELLQTLGRRSREAQGNRKHAEQFLDDNTGKVSIDPGTYERSIGNILESNPAAITAWFSTGSKEDWSANVGLLTTPALVLAGTEEAALGPDAQRKHTLTHLADARLAALEGCGHLAPLERPDEVVHRIATFLESLGLPVERDRAHLGSQFRALIDSSRTSPQTRAVLHQRLQPSAASRATVSADDLLTLRAFAARVVPGCDFDLAARVQSWLAENQHDGWRNDQLPPDAIAWTRGIFSLNAAASHAFGVPFVALDAARQDALLAKAKNGTLSHGLLAALHLGQAKQAFDGSQMQLWFEDARAELAMLYVADPRTMERIGFTGFADDEGFTQIRLGEKETFEL